MWAEAAVGLFSGGGLIAVAGVGKLILDWRKDTREAPISERGSAVSDAQTANAVMVRTIETLERRVDDLTQENIALREKAKDDAEKIADLESRVAQIASELSALKGEL